MILIFSDFNNISMHPVQRSIAGTVQMVK